MEFTIEQSVCIYCGVCADDCPARAIRIDKAAQIARIDHNECIGCGHCGMICPVGAVRVDGNPLPEYPPDVVERVSAAQTATITAHLIRSKRSIRAYTAKPVGEDTLAELLAIGAVSPTATNSCHVDAILRRGKEVGVAAAAIARTLLGVVRLARNPLIRAVFSLFGLRRYAKPHVIDYFYTGLLDTIAGSRDLLFFHAPVVCILTYPKGENRFGRTDCALAGQNVMIHAHAMGVGSCMIGFAEAALWNTRLRRSVGVAQDRRIGLIFTLGYPARSYRRYPVRGSYPSATSIAT